MTTTVVKDKYDIGKYFKGSGQHYGKLCDPAVYQLENGKYILKAWTYQGCADVALIDWHTSDYHLFDTEQEAVNAWVGKKPSGTNWNH